LPEVNLALDLLVIKKKKTLKITRETKLLNCIDLSVLKQLYYTLIYLS